jgi:hypothetical protein
MMLSNIGYAAYGADIEDDTVRLRRRKLEADGDAARRARLGRPRRSRSARRRDAAPASPGRSR